MPHETYIVSSGGGLAGGPTPSGVGTEGPGVAAEGYRGSPGGHQWGGQPVAETGQGGRPGRVTAAESSRSSPSAEHRAAVGTASAPGTRTGGVRVPGRAVDRRPHRPGHPAELWGIVPPGPRGAHPQGLWLESAKARAPGTQRDEQAIRTWREVRWPQVKKRPTRRGAPSSS